MRRLGCAVLAALVLSLPACSSDGHLNLFGYSSKPLFDTTIKTIFVPMSGNTTMVHGDPEFQATRAIVNEINARTPYRVVDHKGGADTELICKLVKHNKMVINQNQLGENREAQLTLTFELVWRDLRPEHYGELLSTPKRREGLRPQVGPDGKEKPPAPMTLSPTANYIPEVGGSDASAKEEIYQKLARQVVNMMELSGTAWR